MHYYSIQGSGVRYIQSGGFRGVLRTEYRVQECALCRVQECITSGGQGSRVHYIQSGGFRSVLCRVQSSGVHNIQRAGFRSVLCAEHRVQERATCRTQGSGVHYVQSSEVYYV